MADTERDAEATVRFAILDAICSGKQAEQLADAIYESITDDYLVWALKVVANQQALNGEDDGN